MNKISIFGAIFSLLLSSCGGGTSDCAGASALFGSITASTCSNNTSSSPPATAIGYFKDSSTEGLTTASGSTSSTTGSDGSFTYEVGKPITFFAGKIKLGTIPVGKSIVTPMDIAADGNISSSSVINIVRFLMMLDDDGDPSNGIRISATARGVLGAVSDIDANVDFKQLTSTFAANINSVITQIKYADGKTHSLPTDTVAASHLTSTVRCAWSGAFAGSYAGVSTSKRYTDGGIGYFIIDAKSGIGIGAYVGAETDSQMHVITNYAGVAAGTEPMTLNNEAAILIGKTAGGAGFQGKFITADKIEGTWVSAFRLLDVTNGTFSISRFGGSPSAKYRFTGSSSDNMVIAIDILGSDSNIISGVLISPVTGVSENINGTFSGTSLSAQSTSGVSLTATLNLVDGTVSNGRKGVASFNATGCSLI